MILVEQVVRNLAEGVVENLQVVDCNNRFAVGHEEAFLRRREVRVSCRLPMEVWDAVLGTKDIVANIDFYIRHRNMDAIYKQLARGNHEMNTFQNILRAARHFNVIELVCPTNSKVQLLRQGIPPSFSSPNQSVG